MLLMSIRREPDLEDRVFHEVLMEKRKEGDACPVTGNLQHDPVWTYIMTPGETPDSPQKGKDEKRKHPGDLPGCFFHDPDL